MAPIVAPLWRHLRAHQIYGANTNVGKTIFATLLCRSAAKNYKNENITFLKPVSTGPDDEADSLCAVIIWESSSSQQPPNADPPQFIPSDDHVRADIYKYASERAALGPGWLFVETAGGVHSPGPSGTTQADLYAPLRLPTILVGDSKLGGISQTISAFESLKIRGYDIESVLLFRDGLYENYRFLKDYFDAHGSIQVESVPEPPVRHENANADQDQMESYYSSLTSEGTIADVLETLDGRGEERIQRLESMGRTANEKIWYPFTQHKLVRPDNIAAIDSAHGDFFQVYEPKGVEQPAEDPVLRPAFDGSASWWTQGLGHGSSKLTLAAAYAAGRYGHVIFPGAMHEPALGLAETLLQGAENPRLSRVFYTDNGSTGCEVAVKMALRAARVRYGWNTSDRVGVLGLKGSYHGDTIGAMDCSEPNIYNENVDWYEGKGFWFDYPTISCREGAWVVDTPKALRQELGEPARFGSLHDVLGLDARDDALCRYKTYIRGVLEPLRDEGRKFGAVVLEPVVLGAGGMVFVDPLFQKALVDVVRESPELFGKPTADPAAVTDQHEWTGLPVVFDEVFTGLYRLGRFSSSSFLQTHADISVHAKLLTGGLVPLCTTLASESIFRAFESDDKVNALLHGHSYTAHPVGCQVALESVREMQKMDRDGSWEWAKSAGGWTGDGASEASSSLHEPAWSVWSRDFVEHVSRQTSKVTGVWALGSVLAIGMRAEDGAGYASKGAAEIQTRFREGRPSWNAHIRVLGNVFYIMASQTTNKETIDELQALCLEALGA